MTSDNTYRLYPFFTLKLSDTAVWGQFLVIGSTGHTPTGPDTNLN